jgi:hypothetical protein
MQIRKLFMLLTVALVIFIFQSCEKYIIEPPVVEEDVTFSGTIQPIFTSKCANCHNGTVHPLNLSLGNSFAALQSYSPESGGQIINTASPEESVLYIMALKGAHGYFSLSANQEAQILKWIQDGAPDN